MPMIVQRQAIGLRPADWTGSVVLNQIHPALNIQSAGVVLDATLESSVAVESLEAAPATFTSLDQASVSLERPDGTTLLAATPSTFASFLLTAADGIADERGASGRTLPGATGTQSATAILYRGQPASPDAALLIGTGTVQLPVVATARVAASGPGNMVAMFHSQVAAAVSTRVETASATGGTTDTYGSFSATLSPSSPFIISLIGSLTTAPQQRIIADQTTGTAAALMLDGFDPALGQFLSVDVRIAADAKGAASAENLDMAASNVTITQSATVSLVRPDGTALAQGAAGFSTARQLAAFDGTVDYTGLSGITLAGLQSDPASRASDTILDAPADLLPFVGAHAITVAMMRSGQTTINGPGNLAVTTALQAGATVTVTYQYLPGMAQPVPSPSPNLVGFGETRTLASSLQGTTVGFGSTVVVPQGVFSTPVTVLPGGHEVVQGGAQVQGAQVIGPSNTGTALAGTALAGATLQVDAGGQLAGASVDNGSTAAIDGSALALQIGRGLVTVRTGGRTVSSQVGVSGTELVAGGTSVGAQVGAGGTQIVGNGGTAEGTSLRRGAGIVESGGAMLGASLGQDSTLLVEGGGRAAGLTFTGTGAVLTLRAGAQAGPVQGFAAGDTIDLRDVAYTTALRVTLQAQFGAAVLTVASADSSTSLFVLPQSDYGVIGFGVNDIHLVADAAGAGTAITITPFSPPSPDPLLNSAYYLAHNPDVAAYRVDPYQHYLASGWTEGRNPSAWFDTSLYLAQNPDVAAAGLDPLLHFEQYGAREGRDPSLLFSGSQYLAANPDVAAAGVNPLQHYMQFGQAEGRMTFLSGGSAAADPLVDAAYYDHQLGATLIPSGTAAAQQAAWSYDTSGWQRGLNPDGLFDTAYYLSHNPDVAAAHINPLLHFERYGWAEGRDPSAQFSTSRYLAAYSDVRVAGIDPLLHYVQYGQAEGRTAYTV